MRHVTPAIDTSASGADDPYVGSAQSSNIIKRAAPSRVRTAVWLTILLLVAAALRLQDLTEHAFVLDECWSMEIATGRGSLHQHLPVDAILPPPPFFSLMDAPPWWKIWSHMEVTHPPLYSILLRWWEDLGGDTDYGGRLFSVIASLAAVAILFDTVRLQSGLAAAVWAALLMVLASPQIEHARLARSYTLLLAFALAAANIVVRIQVHGMSHRRRCLLVAAILATLMTHYFCIGAIIGLAVYITCCLRTHRRQLLVVIASTGFFFAIIWGPWMWRQRYLFATDDPGTLFLSSDTSNHTRNTIIRILMNPTEQLFPQAGVGTLRVLAMLGGIAVCFAPFLPYLRRKNPSLMMWSLWISGTLSVVALLDFTRGTDHLRFIRYTILAGPAICALIPSVFSATNRWRPAMHLLSCLAVIGCLMHLPDVYGHDDPDPRQLAHELIAAPGPQDLLVFGAPAADKAKCEIELLMLARYLQPMSCPVALLTHAADTPLIDALHHDRFIFLDTQSPAYQSYFPGAVLLKARTYRGLGNLFTLQLQPTALQTDQHPN